MQRLLHSDAHVLQNKGSTPNQAFPAVQQCFLWERVTLTLGFFTFQTFYMHKTASEHNKGKEKTPKSTL